MTENKTFTVKPNMEISLTRQDIDDIMCCALEGGINYWSYNVEVVGDYLGEYASEQISRGGELNIYEVESGEKYTLTRKKFLNGVKLCMEQGYHVALENNAVDPGDMDSEDADRIVQLALFEDVIYG